MQASTTVWLTAIVFGQQWSCVAQTNKMHHAFVSVLLLVRYMKVNSIHSLF